jgi:DNA-binding transcriptional MerR regulator
MVDALMAILYDGDKRAHLMATAAARPAPIEIPNKLYFRIGDVVRLTGVKAYVLRYWETEFPMLKPKKSGTNQRLYRRKDVEMALEIKRLLYDQRFTIEGARTHIEHRRHAPKPPVPKPVTAPADSMQSMLFGAEVLVMATARKDLAGVRAELKSILELLS